MSTSYYADRTNLFVLLQQHPEWSHQEYADALQRSKSWVDKWCLRFQNVPTGDLEALQKTRSGPVTSPQTAPGAYCPRD